MTASTIQTLTVLVSAVKRFNTNMVIARSWSGWQTQPEEDAAMGLALALVMATVAQAQQQPSQALKGFQWTIEIQSIATKETRTFRTSTPLDLPDLWGVTCTVTPQEVTLVDGSRSQFAWIMCSEPASAGVVVWTTISTACIEHTNHGGVDIATAYDGLGALQFQRIATDRTQSGATITVRCIR